jgi:hypothetical protein
MADDDMSDDKKELKVIFHPEVKEKMEKDPDLRKYLQEFVANLHQARDAVDRGIYPDMDTAVAAITGGKVTHHSLDDFDDEDID